ncbi:hypothetical protein DMH88_14620 [Escherichia coli]|nr:hypothetical protein [Escherichia coli]
MPDGMRSAIAERAKRNGRSMNSEIVQILEDALSYDVSSVDKSLDLKQIKSLLDKISNELLDRIPKTHNKTLSSGVLLKTRVATQ